MSRKKKKPCLAALALLLFVGSATVAPACAPVVSHIPTVLKYVTTAMAAVEAIDSFADSVFVAAPNPDLQKKINIAIARTYSALAAAQAATQGVEHLTQQQIDEAWADFRRYYQELLALSGPLGVRSVDDGERMSASPALLTVPRAPDLVPRL